MYDRADIKKKEQAALQEIYKAQPELFEQKTFLDDAHTLKGVGIELPNKSHYPLGYLKLWPQDFIVEEIAPDGQIYTVTYENVLTPDTIVDENQPTIYATLVKCGVSTIEVIRDMCAMLSCTADQIQYAGIKDKDAITAQRISFRNISFEKIKNLSSAHFFLKDVTSGKGVIQKSSLKGNKFTILIRTEDDFTTTDKFHIFAANLKTVKLHGFYNFYYLQRFGTPRLNNYLWAISILKGDYKQAVHDALSAPGERELDYFKKLRKDISNHFGDWAYIQNLIKPFPLMFPSETKLVDHLVSHPEDFVGALQQIPEQVQIWIYALSSYLFNKKLSEAALNNKLLPREIPLFLSNNAHDWSIYESFLRELNLIPPPFKNLRPFPSIQLRTRTVSTRDEVEIHGAEIITEGIVLSFSLNKGDYATTFLSHLFTLIGGIRPDTIIDTQVDTKEAFKDLSLQPTLEYFKPVIEIKDLTFIEDSDK